MKKYLKYFILTISSVLFIFLVVSCNNSNDSTTPKNDPNPQVNTKNGKYTVKWKNWDDTILEIDEDVEYGTTPTYDGDTPTRDADQNNKYVFNGWDKIIASVTKDIEYKAVFDVVPASTQYKVEHYLQNVNDNKYTIDSTETLYGETNTYTKAEAKDYTGFTTPNVQQQIINGNGTTVIKLYYEIKSYEISVTNNYSAGEIVGIGTHKYGEKVNIEITPYMGYEYEGIYIDNNFITKELSYEIDSISSNVEIRFKVLKDLDNFTFESTKDTLKITGIKDKTVKSIKIPNSVTSIGNYAFYNCSSLTSIEIPNSVTSIGSEAFFNCSSITNITIPNTVTSIGEKAFFNCSSLTNITIPDSVTSIGNGAFYNCSSLTNITIPNGVTSIENGAFYNCSSLTNITIPNSVTSIGSEAFYNCSSITSITIPNTVTSIGEKAFFNCSSITNITIPDSVTSIGSSAFSNCSLLTSITIPSSVTSIGNYAFADCSSLSNIIIPNSVKSIGNGAFCDCLSLTSITIPNSVTSIGNSAFDGCRSLTSVTISNNVTSIENYAFYGCLSLISITIPSSVTSIGNDAFDSCYKLVEVINKSSLNITTGSSDYGNIAYYAKQVISDESESKLSTDKDGFITYNVGTDIWLVNYIGNDKDIVIPNNVTKINDYAFYGCLSLTSITIPSSVTSIKRFAFGYCVSLKNITIPNSVTSIGNYAFDECVSLANVYYDGKQEEWSLIEIGNNNSKLTSATRYYYSEIKPSQNGNYWHYVDGIITIWE